MIKVSAACIQFSWPIDCNLPQWLVQPDHIDKPTSVWWLEMTDGNSPSGRIFLDR